MGKLSLTILLPFLSSPVSVFPHPVPPHELAKYQKPFFFFLLRTESSSTWSFYSPGVFKGTRAQLFSILSLPPAGFRCRNILCVKMLLGNVLLCNYLTRPIFGPILDTFECPSLILETGFKRITGLQRLNMKKNGFCRPIAIEWKVLSIILQLVTKRKMAFPL